MPPDRRGFLRGAAFAVLLPMVAGAARPARAQAVQGRDQGGVQAAPAFSPPGEPMIYTRRLERELAPGANYIVSRSFAIRFQPEGSGYLVDGRQVDVEVDAPAQLEVFAEMERQRREQNLFPLTLTPAGMIAGTKEIEEVPQLDAAVDEVLARIDLEVAVEDRATLTRFASAVHENAALLLSNLPRDLFVPEQRRHMESRSIDLPGGEEGVVTAIYTAEIAPGTGLMCEARREIVSEIGGVRRRTVESWTLQPQAAG